MTSPYKLELTRSPLQLHGFSQKPLAPPHRAGGRNNPPSARNGRCLPALRNPRKKKKHLGAGQKEPRTTGQRQHVHQCQVPVTTRACARSAARCSQWLPSLRPALLTLFKQALFPTAVQRLLAWKPPEITHLVRWVKQAPQPQTQARNCDRQCIKEGTSQLDDYTWQYRRNSFFQ